MTITPPAVWLTDLEFLATPRPSRSHNPAGGLAGTVSRSWTGRRITPVASMVVTWSPIDADNGCHPYGLVRDLHGASSCLPPAHTSETPASSLGRSSGRNR